MTDKATVEMPSPVAGTVVALGGEVGEVLAVGAELIRIDAPGLPQCAARACAEGARESRGRGPSACRRAGARGGA